MNVELCESACKRHDQPFPDCELHGCRIVYEFPAGCPFRCGNPLQRIMELQRRGWDQVANDRDSWAGYRGRTLLNVGDICHDCIGRLSAHRHVRYLRSKETINA